MLIPYTLVSLLALNIITFAAYGLDKSKARKRRWRIPESTLLWMAALGGSLGAWLGMNVWHHKTLHLKFRLGVPLLLILHLILVGMVIIRFEVKG